MDKTYCYRLLGLDVGADVEQIKTAYRYLARKYHPDFNPGNQESQIKFIELTEAYKLLLNFVTDERKKAPRHSFRNNKKTNSSPTHTTPEYEQKLKQDTYKILKKLLQESKLARAVAVVEALAQRLPQDVEVRQWQAIVYQQWGRQMLKKRQWNKAKVYLNKALKTDPYNRALRADVQEDLRRIEKMI